MDEPTDEPTEADPTGAERDLRDRLKDGVATILRFAGDNQTVEDIAEFTADQAMSLLSGRALVGGRSAAPTRERILRAIAAAMVSPELASRIMTDGIEQPDGVTPLAAERWGRAADAVVALLSLPAAEPPDEIGVADVEEAMARAQREHARTWPSCATAHGVAAGPQATPDQVLWEGPTKQVGHLSVPIDAPLGTHIRVVAVPTGDQEPDHQE